MGKKRILLFAIMIVFMSYGFIIASKTISQRREKAKIFIENEKEIAVLKKDINNLNKEIKESSSPEFVEKVAREDFGMVKPREIIYVDKDKHSKDTNLQEINE